MNNQCRWLHDWGTWKFVEQVSAHKGNKNVGVVTTQCRKCNRCGYTQTKLDTELTARV